MFKRTIISSPAGIKREEMGSLCALTMRYCFRIANLDTLLYSVKKNCVKKHYTQRMKNGYQNVSYENATQQVPFLRLPHNLIFYKY